MSEWSKMMSRRRRKARHRMRRAAKLILLLFLALVLAIIIAIKPKEVVGDVEAEQVTEVLPIPEVEKLVLAGEEYEPDTVEIAEVSEPEVVEPKLFYYEIPEEYKKADLTRELQEYLYDECQKRDIDYSIALALIERESGYYSKCCGDDGNSKGYMQIYQRWHREEIEAEGVSDLYDPEGNIRVGLDILQSLYDEYGNSGDNCVLMVYNMGYTAKKLWARGVYSSEYSRYITQRAKEIKQDLQE